MPLLLAALLTNSAQAVPPDRAAPASTPISTPVSAAQVSAAAAHLDAYPQDYSAAMALARAGTDAADWAQAERGWRVAHEVSKGNLDSGVGLVVALVAQLRYVDATEIAEELVVQYPDAYRAWLAKGWAWRFRDLPGGRGVEVASKAYGTAAKLDPSRADAWCGLGWLRASRGDSEGAQEAFRNARRRESTPGCGSYGARATLPTWTTYGSAFVFTSQYGAGSAKDTALGAGVQVSAALGGSAWVDVTASAGHVGTKNVDGSTGYNQAEVWARAGGQVGRLGGTAVLGSNGDSKTVGGLAWYTFGPSVRLEGAHTTFEGGGHLQIGAAFVVPIHRSLSTSVGWRWTYQNVDGANTDDHALWASATAKLAGGSVTLGGRIGHEIRPVRLLQSTSWTSDVRLGPSAFGQASIPLSPSLSLQAGAELTSYTYGASLQAPLAPSSDTQNQSISGTVGLTWSFGAARQEK